jgi:hypothetical protein
VPKVTLNRKTMGDKRDKKRKADNLASPNDTIQEMIQNFNPDQVTTIPELARFMMDYIISAEKMRQDILNNHFRLDEIEEKIEKLEDAQKSTDTTTTKNCNEIKILKVASEDNSSSVHKLEQFNVDNDVFLSQFPCKPDAEKVTQKLLQFYGISKETVSNTYAYEFKIPLKNNNKMKQSTPVSSQVQQQYKVVHHMVIGFKDKTAKMNFMKAKKEKGPIKAEQLFDSGIDQDSKMKTISCSNRLSKFNLMVQRVLFDAKAIALIESFQLHNGTFRLKTEKESKWIFINNEDDLKPYRAAVEAKSDARNNKEKRK